MVSCFANCLSQAAAYLLAYFALFSTAASRKAKEAKDSAGAGSAGRAKKRAVNPMKDTSSFKVRFLSSLILLLSIDILSSC